MDVLTYLIPISLLLGAAGLVGFIYTVRSNQYDDPDGDSRRILTDDYDDAPRPDVDPTPPKDAADAQDVPPIDPDR